MAVDRVRIAKHYAPHKTVSDHDERFFGRHRNELRYGRISHMDWRNRLFVVRKDCIFVLTMYVHRLLSQTLQSPRCAACGFILPTRKSARLLEPATGPRALHMPVPRFQLSYCCILSPMFVSALPRQGPTTRGFDGARIYGQRSQHSQTLLEPRSHVRRPGSCLSYVMKVQAFL